MADSYIQVAADGAGKKLQTKVNTIGGNDVHAEAVIQVDSNGVPISPAITGGAANLAIGRVTSSSSAGTLVIARPTRRSVLIRNLDSAITIYVGPATVTTANGFPILPGESCAFTWTGLIQFICSSGTPSIATADEYD